MIKLLVTDCDGVLTPDYKWYTQSGDLIKRFSTKDMTAIRQLERLGVKTVVLSGDDRVNAKVCELHRLEFVHAIHNKDQMIEEIAKRHNVSLSEILYIGDDLPDISAGKRVGLFMCPHDAVKEVRTIVHKVLSIEGGNGVIPAALNEIRHLINHLGE